MKNLLIMKKSILVLAVGVVAISLSSCYRHSVCATYVKEDAKIKKEVVKDLDQNL